LYLKSMEIQGFKSFAEKIKLEFTSGITTVVGPNGSGKSNISDAVRWVLGEQSAKSLRGSKMEDIIFAGTQHRKPVGFASVSLTIDNGDGELQVEYTEVTITRRVYRSGESEYMINGTSCRLKDIHMMFMNTGVGKEGYSIIGQGRVDEILSTKSDERRLIFEEASGIMKYKIKKLEAERKLEYTEQNLLRINDIVNELENQLIPLKEQAETAKAFLSLREKLKEIEVSLFLESISSCTLKITELNENYNQIKELIEQETSKLEEITSSNKQKNERQNQLKQIIEKTRQEIHDIENNIERCKNQIQIKSEKIVNIEQNNERFEKDILELETRISALLQEKEKKNKRVLSLEKSYSDFEQMLSEAQTKMNVLIQDLDQNEKNIEFLKQSVMDKLDSLSEAKISLHSQKNQIESINLRQDAINKQLRQIILEKDRELMLKEDLDERLQKLTSSMNEASLSLVEINNRNNMLSEELDKVKSKQNIMLNELQMSKSKLKVLSDMEHNLEGYNRSVKAILQLCENSKDFGKGIYGALAQLIEVEASYEVAVETALGGALQNIITENEYDAKRAIEYLKKERLGRATFLPISSINGKRLEHYNEQQVKNEAGFCGIAADLVSYDNKFIDIINSLLGRVVVVDKMDNAITIARKYKYSFRIVTLEGDLLNSGGSMSGGSTANKSSSILSRHRVLKELEESINELKHKLNESEVQCQKYIKELNICEEKRKELESSINELKLTKLRDESQLNQVNDNIKRFSAQAEVLTNEKEELKQNEEEGTLEVEKYSDEIKSIEANIEETKNTISLHHTKNKETQAVRDELLTDINDYKVSIHSISESISNVKENIEQIEYEKNDLVNNIARRQEERDKNLQNVESIRAEILSYNKEIEVHTKQRDGRNLSLEGLLEENRVLEGELAGIVERVNDINKSIMLMQEDYNRVEVKKTKLESELEVFKNKLWDEYELTYNNALEMKKEISNIRAAQQQINQYRSEIRELGPVNVAAIEDYSKTKERATFMSNQKEDLELSKDKLYKVIQEMTSIMKKQFMEQFEIININFNIVFRELFEGGRAELSLADKENILESGIDIIAQPPGKKLQNMMLLSGGERALTAIALLFAILKMRPTPFCILDEIEAALDDANVFKFAQYIKRFTKQTQFVVITHRKGTMEVADTLYGVTMQEHGVSKVVSMKLEA